MNARPRPAKVPAVGILGQVPFREPRDMLGFALQKQPGRVPRTFQRR